MKSASPYDLLRDRMDLQELRQRINHHGLADFEQEILSVARPCLTIQTSMASNPIPAARSKIGGMPDLPINSEWPHGERSLRPLLFLARIVGSDLSRIHPHLTNCDLLFFGDFEYEEGRIIRIEQGTPVSQRSSPERETDWMPLHLTECNLNLSDAIALPSPKDEFESWRYSEEVRTHGARKELIWGGTYEITITPLEELWHEHPYRDGQKDYWPHRLFGYPLFVQGHPAMLPEQRFTRWSAEPVERQAFIRNAARWQSIASFNTDEIANLSFGDTGTCGFLVTEEDLQRGDFDAAEFYSDSM